MSVENTVASTSDVVSDASSYDTFISTYFVLSIYSLLTLYLDTI